MAAADSPSSKPSRGGWKSAIFIIFVEVAERFAYYGVSGNLFMYLTKVLGHSTASAAKSVNTWQGVSAIFPVVGGFLADSYVGRFKTIIFSSVIYLTGLILLTLAVSTVPIQTRPTIFFIALYILTVGEGGHKPCVQTFAADQFDDNVPEEKAAKGSFFNWWYVGIVSGATAAVLVVIYVEDYVGWNWGFGMLAIAVATALVVFLVGSRGYRRQAPVGSPFTRLAQVLVAAVRKRQLPEREARGLFVEDGEYGGLNVEGGSGDQTLARTSQFRFLDKAAMIYEHDAPSEKRNPWCVTSTQQVEEAKQVFQLIPIWFSCLMFAVDIAQLGTFFTKQTSTLRRSITATFTIPAASFQVIPGLTILTAVLLYERLLIPLLRRLTGHPSGITILQRIGTGLFLSILTMVVAAAVETKRVNHAARWPEEPMTAWWVVPQYVMVGLSDVFAVVGLQELFYDQMPVGMRSVGAAAYITVTGVGSFLSSGLIAVVQAVSGKAGEEWLGNDINTARLENYYWVLAGMSAVNLCVYVCVAKRFVYRRI